MPVLSSTTLLNTVIAQNATSPSPQPANTTDIVLQVVCAWPVSGQYGPGSRVLYYVLVAACVLARKKEWLRNACLAAALLFPAVAALHGIVLAATHVNGAVDMDVFGAFQLCSIGILAAPVTVRLSRTYFYDPGRNAIFVWTGLILAGLLSLTVEFFRINPSPCPTDDAGKRISADPSKFPYDSNPSCGLVCSIEDGPFSPMRRDSTNNIYVIPAPDKLTFGTATLLAAGCCIPAILSLISMWNKILEINWKSRFGDRNGDEHVDETIEGTNGATISRMKGVNSKIRFLLSVIEVPAFSVAVLAILITGERNLFSRQVSWQTEPIQSIGQWAPIVGTGLAALGSFYLVLAEDVEAVKRETSGSESEHHCHCSHHHYDTFIDPSSHGQHAMPSSPSSQDTPSSDDDDSDGRPHRSSHVPAMQEVGIGLFPAVSSSAATTGASDIRPCLSNELASTISRPSPVHENQPRRSWTGDAGSRRKVAATLTAIGNYLGNAAPDRFDDSEFKTGKALDFPEIPGEESRNRVLSQIREQYNQPRDADGHVTPMLRSQRSRAASFNGSVASGFGLDEGTDTPKATSPTSASQFRSPSPVPSLNRRPYSNTLPSERRSFEAHDPAPSPGQWSAQVRRNTLEVPSPTYHPHVRSSLAALTVENIITLPRDETSPIIVVSSDPEMTSLSGSPITESPKLQQMPLPPPQQ